MFDQNSKVIPVDIKKEMEKSFLDYSMSVIVSRALPDVRDGLKPVHRRILYTMYENSLYPDRAYRKCADTVGSVLGGYHPHGDASVYDALVRMAQDFSLRYMLVDGHGNFGSVDGDPPAAYRYTEARMSKISMAMLTDIDKETVDFAPNYDDRKLEPVMLPSRFPNLLVNGSTGIAVGMATNIPPHNLTEVISALGALIDNPDIELEGLMEHIKGPDFPTAGIIMGRSGIRSAYATGQGRITLRARAEIEDMANNRQRIVVTEIPYQVNKARLIIAISELVKNKRVEQISDLRDESDRDGMRIVVELKRDANAQLVLNQLYQYTQMQETVSVNMLALQNGRVPKVFTLKEALSEYLDFQISIIRRRCEYELRKAKERAHILEGLKIAQDNIDEVISIVRSSRGIPESRQNLMDRFALTYEQANAIVQMRIGQLSGLEREKIEEELRQIQIRIAELEEILGDNQKILEIIRTELDELKTKFGDERRTEIQSVSGEIDIESLIPVEECVITLTHYGYIKRQKMDVYKSQRRGGRGISGLGRRDEDFVEELFICSSHDYIMLFTDKGKVYRIKCYEIPEGSRASRGTNIVNLLQIPSGDKITSVIKVSEIDEESFLTMVTRRGTIKRTPLSDYKNVRASGLIAINLNEGEELAWVKLTGGSHELIVATRNGMAIRFKETDVRSMGRTAHGVRAIRLQKDDEIVGMARLREGASIVTITDNGLGRRTLPEQYRLQTRGGMGIRNYRINEATGKVAGIRTVDESDDLIIITDDGVIIRIDAGEITMQSRHGRGVKAMRVSEGARIVTLARALKEEADENEEGDGLDENGEEIIAEDNQATEAAGTETEASGEINEE